ncbi:MAG TPA: DUF3368 domain-containing protein [Tepidisphaeraceae bacterium]
MIVVVVSDTSPIRCLVHISHIDILPALFGKVLVPPAVVNELANPSGAFAPIDFQTLPGLILQAPHTLAHVQPRYGVLHPGETEALALAIELGANALLMDDQAGRSAAELAGIQPIGTIGILLRAKKRNLIQSVKPILDKLILDLNFFVSTELRQRALSLANETD